jgi:hypothetical protein
MTAGAAPLDARTVGKSLATAAQLVGETHRQAEWRRLIARLAGASVPTVAETVTVPRSAYEALVGEQRSAAGLRRLFDSGPVMPVAFDAHAPHLLRDASLALARASGRCLRPGLLGQPLKALFDPPSQVRLLTALASDDEAVSSLTLHCTDGGTMRCQLHLAARDPLEPDLRRACLVIAMANG